MKKFVSFFICASALLSGCAIKTSESEQIEPLTETLISSKVYNNTIDLASSVAPAIVGIGAYSSAGQSVGSGVCVAKNGIIITNSHVVTDSSQIEVYLSSGDVGVADLLWEDTVQDLAIIKANKSIPYLPISTDNNLNVGEDVVAVGTPLSLILKHTFTKGIVSALNRTLKIDTKDGVSYMQNLIQHDASLNPGNSGGPLINLNGEVVGINTLKINGGEGIGFAIPSTSFSSLVDSVVASKTTYQTPYLGAFGFDAEIANFNKLTDEKQGYYVLDVADNSPLKKLGLTKGSIIKKLNNNPIVTTADLRKELYKFSYGDKVVVEYIKDGNPVKESVVLAKNNLR